MTLIRPFLAVTAVAVATATAFLPTSASAASASVPICGGTSLVTASGVGVQVRVPTVGNATPSKWGCDLLPSNVAGLVPVERLQIDLNNCYGIRYHFQLAVDGEYGPDTTKAVEIVQGAEGVPVTGDYGPQTIIGGNEGGPFQYQLSGFPADECDGIAGS